jgi:hypothetical protein
MQNPFKTGDIVPTKLKGKEIQAAVSKIWKNEVQVKTTEGELLWQQPLPSRAQMSNCAGFSWCDTCSETCLDGEVRKDLVKLGMDDRVFCVVNGVNPSGIEQWP